MNEKTYYLVNFNSLNIQEDLNVFYSYLSKIPTLKITLNENTVKISYPTTNLEAILKIVQQQSPMITHSSMLLQCSVGDYDTIRILRSIAPKLHYRFYNPSLSCFLPEDPNLVEISQIILKENAVKVFQTYKFQPIYFHLKANVYFAQPEGKTSVHIINPALFDYFVKYGIDPNPTSEFNYEVAQNLVDFTAYFDHDAIPLNFYSYYQKSLKILNHCGFDIEHINRKVFVKPLLFLYDKNKQEYTLTPDKSALNFADKIRTGETLDITIKRILKEELKISQDYARAKVIRVEFDRDRDNILTPRLIVPIYLNDYQFSKEVQEKSQRSWTSLNVNRDT